MKSFEGSGAIKTEILARFMRGELNASGAACELRATLSSDAEYDYLVWPQGNWSQDLLQKKIAELTVAMQDVPIVRISHIDRDVPSGTFPFRSTDFAERAEILRRQTVRDWITWLGPLLILAFAGLGLRMFVPSLASSPLVPFLFAWVLVFSTVAFLLGFRGERLTRRQGLVCPSCGSLLFGSRRRGGLVHLEVLETGRCPQFRTRLLHPVDVPVDSSAIAP